MPDPVEQGINVKPPSPLKLNSENMASEWKDFLQRYEWYSTATKLSAKTPEIQAAVFMSTIGEEAIPIFNSFQLPEEDKKKVEVLKRKFTEYFVPRENESFVRWNFFRFRQSETETFDEFLTEAKTKIAGCNFEALADGLLRDKIVFGVRSDQVREKLLAEENLTLAKAINICRVTEQATKQLKELKGDELKIDRVKKKASDFAHQQRGVGSNFRNGHENSRKQNSRFVCKRCGASHPPMSCPAYKKQCRKCKKVGHFAKVCKFKNVEIVNKSDDSDKTNSDPNDSLYLDAVTLHVNTVYDWFENVDLSGRSVLMKLDTGAQCNVINLDIAKSISAPLEKTKVKKLISFSNHEMKVLGEINTEVRVKNKTSKLKFIVVGGDVKPILGGESCVELGLIKRVMSTEKESLPDDWKTQIFNGLGCLKDFTYDIDIDKNADLEFSPPRKIPFALRDEVKKEIDNMVNLGVLEPVNEPSYAVSPLVIVRKHNKIRVCVDPSKLNKFVKRRHYPLKTVEEIAGKIKGAKHFALLDCKRGFWQLKVTKRTSKYLTVNTPWGRFSYKRIPFGLVSAPEIYQQQMSELLKDFDNVECSMDDVLIFANSKVELNELVDKVMKRLFLAGLKLNKEKCVLSAVKVKFLGHILDENGVSPDPEKVSAINKLKPPTNITELRRFLGLANYLGKFIPNFSHVSEPLRKLLEKEIVWEWSESQENSFKNIKQLVSSAPVLGYYDVNKPVTVTVDASSTALGAVLSQNSKPIAYATRSLSKSEKNFPQIEKEALAMRFGCDKFHQYIYGKELIIETDHKPLESIGKKSIVQAPPRLQRIFYDILQYNPIIVYKKGTSIPVADALSRDCDNTEQDCEEDTCIVHVVLPMSENTLNDFKRETNNDQELATLKCLILKGWPEERKDVPLDAQKYWNFRDELSIYDDLLFKGERVLVPATLKKRLLDVLHQGHLGIQSSLRRARESFYFYGMNAVIEEMIRKCKICQETQPNKPKEQVLMKPVPEFPFQRVASDLFEFNKQQYIVMADSFSGFYDFKKLRHATSRECIDVLKRWFSVHGIPEILESDNGTQYASKRFHAFLDSWGIQKQRSSPYHPQSNGLAERAVEASKILLKRCSKDNSDIALALLNLRNTPREAGLMSINQRLMSRTTRSLLPSTTQSLKPRIVEDGAETLRLLREKKTQVANKHISRQIPATLHPGEDVRVQAGARSWIGGKIEKMVNPRSAIVKVGDKTIRRNTIHIQPTSAELSPPFKSSLNFQSDSSCPDTTPRPSDVVPPPAPQVVPSPPPKLPVQVPSSLRTRSGRIVKPVKKMNL